MENTKVEVKINNMEYTIVSNESEEYVQRVALLVNKKISEVKAQEKQLSTAMLAVMAAMNLADELLKSDMTVDNLRNEMGNYMDEAQKNGSELERKKLEVETLKEDLHKLEIELAKRETELENLRGSAARSASRPMASGSNYKSASQQNISERISSYTSASQHNAPERDGNYTSASQQGSTAQSAAGGYRSASAMDKYRK